MLTPDYILNTFGALQREDFVSVIDPPDIAQIQHQLWYTYISKHRGFCFVFDLARNPDYEYLQMSDLSVNPYIMLEFKPNELQTAYIVGLSSEADLPDSHTLYPQMYMSTYWSSLYELRIAKKVIQSVSTKKDPCSPIPKHTCLEQNLYQLMLEKYACELLFLKDGKHLTVIKKTAKDSYIKICNMSIHQEAKKMAFENINNFIGELGNTCYSKQACIQAKYSIQSEQMFNADPKANTSMKIQYMDPIVEYNIDSLMACSSSLDDSSPSARHVFVLASSSGLRGRRRTYLTIL
jgi:hypothetical protein